MKIKVIMPRWGSGMNEGTVAKWFKVAGEAVTKGEPIADIETEKAVQELEAPVSGVIAEILVPEGTEVAVRTPIAVIDAS